MKLLVIGSGMMGSAAAYDMARTPQVASIMLADNDVRRARDVAARVNRITGEKKVRATELDASDSKAAAKLMHGHDAALSAVPYFLNLGLAKAAIEARCHFADLGGNNTAVRQELALAEKAEKRGVAIAPDCGLSPGMASILGGELGRRLGGRADALKLYVGGLPEKPMPPFHYQLVFSVEGLINEYVEPARILRKGKLTTIEALTEPEDFHMPGFAPLIAFHTSGGTSTLPETFEGRVGECFEKTLRYPGHYDLLCELKELGLFSSEKMRINGTHIAPRTVMSKIFEGKFAGKGPRSLHHATRSARIRENCWCARIAGRPTERTRGVLYYGRSLRSQNGHECNDENHRLSSFDCAADARFGGDYPTWRHPARTRRSRRDFSRRDGRAWDQD
jgi:lysine 6-dehydrogenase